MNTVVDPPLTALAHMGRGFLDPVHGAQRVFRAVLDAMARPGRVQTLTDAAIAGIEPPGLARASTAVLLALLDGEVDLWLDPAMDASLAPDYLRFHTGMRWAADPHGAAFVLTRADCATPRTLLSLDRGSDAVPQAGATLIIDVPALSEGRSEGVESLVLRGPGIADRHVLAIGGLDASFWGARRAIEADYPRGIDLIVCCGDTLAALPRTTRVEMER